MTKQLTISEEELAKIISIAIFGYNAGVNSIFLTHEQIRFLYDSTLESIKEGGFIEELILAYDKDLFDEMKEQIEKMP